jgi:hypothetical protein
MGPLKQRKKQVAVVIGLLSSIFLACGPLNRWQQLNQQQQAIATSATLIGENSHLIAAAFNKLQTSSSYRLESRTISRDQTGHQTSHLVVTVYDALGNVYTLTHTPDGQQNERYFIEGQTYVFEPQYQGWVKSEVDMGPETQAPAGISPADLAELLIQIGTTPIEVGQETLDDRPATRYKLRYVVTEIAEALDLELADPPLELRGMLWLDDETGVPLKSEILLYDDKTGQPVQEFVLEISDIDNIDPIAVPSPVVDPAAMVAATATAQAWTVLPVELDHQGEQISFEAIPLGITQTPNVSPSRAEVRLILRQLPDFLFLGANLEPFLAQLRHQMTLSLPSENLVITSSGFRLEYSAVKDQQAEVIYFFNADLTGFNNAELIITGRGNPLFAPVPVER